MQTFHALGSNATGTVLITLLEQYSEADAMDAILRFVDQYPGYTEWQIETRGSKDRLSESELEFIRQMQDTFRRLEAIRAHPVMRCDANRDIVDALNALGRAIVKVSA